MTGDRPRFLGRQDTTPLLEALARVVAMESAGIHPALVHAFRITGLLVSEDNHDLWAPSELALWNRAVERYRPGVPVDGVVPPSGRIAAFLANSPSTAC